MAKYIISQFTMPDGNIIELKDKVARDAVAGGTYFMGVTTVTEITDGSSTTSIVIDGETKTASNGAIVVYGVKEFIYASADSKWHELGDVSMLGSLAVKNSASGAYTPAGSVSATFSGSNISYTPTGLISKPSVTVTETSATISEFATAGSVTAGSAASATMPTLTFTPDASTENLTIAWTSGSFTPNVPTSVTLPTSKQTSVLSGASAELDAAPSFTGTAATLVVDGSISASFTGTAATITVE